MNDDQPPSKQVRSLFQQLGGLFHKLNSKQDLREYLQDAQDNNVIDTEEAAMMAGVLAVYEQRVRDVMLPKSKMVTVSEGMTFNETISLVLDSGHSRFPVEQDGNIIGVLLAKDLLGYLRESTDNFSITQLMRPIHHIPESKPLDIMLREFRLRRLHIAIVTNEYGDLAGLVTIEDVLEEIVGEIGDEHDNESGEDIKKVGNDKYLVTALTEIEDFNDYFGTTLDTDTHDTIGGLMLAQFGYVPQANESVTFDDFNFTVKTADDRRILEVLISR